MEKKRQYEAPAVRRVRLDVKESVLGTCQKSPTFIIAPNCDVQGGGCPTVPEG